MSVAEDRVSTHRKGAASTPLDEVTMKKEDDRLSIILLHSFFDDRGDPYSSA
jgi:hypothetical protein